MRAGRRIVGSSTQSADPTQGAAETPRHSVDFRAPTVPYEMAEGTRLPVIMKTPAKGRLLLGDARQWAALPRAERSKNFIVALRHQRGRLPSAPLISAIWLVAGAGFEPATFGL